MSRKVYHDIIEPIILKLLGSDPKYGSEFRPHHGHTVGINDPNLEEYMLKELINRYGVAGRVDVDLYGRVREDSFCDPLDIILREMDINELERVIEELLHTYIKINLAIRAGKIKKPLSLYASKQTSEERWVEEHAMYLKKRKKVPVGVV